MLAASATVVAAAAVWAAAAPVAAAAVGASLLPTTVANNTGRGEAVYLDVLCTNRSTARLGYVNAGGAFSNLPAGSNPPTLALDVSIGRPGNGGTTTLQFPVASPAGSTSSWASGSSCSSPRTASCSPYRGPAAT